MRVNLERALARPRRLYPAGPLAAHLPQPVHLPIIQRRQLCISRNRTIGRVSTVETVGPLVRRTVKRRPLHNALLRSR